MEGTHLTRAGLTRWLTEKIAEEIGTTPESVDPEAQLNQLGLDSGQAVVLAGELGRHVGFKVSVALLWDHPTIAGLAAEVAAMAEARGAK